MWTLLSTGAAASRGVKGYPGLVSGDSAAAAEGARAPAQLGWRDGGIINIARQHGKKRRASKPAAANAIAGVALWRAACTGRKRRGRRQNINIAARQTRAQRCGGGKSRNGAIATTVEAHGGRTERGNRWKPGAGAA